MKTLREEDVLRVVGSDAYAISFQTMGQYRSALIKAILALPDASPQGPVSEEREGVAEQIDFLLEWLRDHDKLFPELTVIMSKAARLLRAPQPAVSEEREELQPYPWWVCFDGPVTNAHVIDANGRSVMWSTVEGAFDELARLLRAPQQQAEPQPWRVDLSCCGRDGGTYFFPTWEEADAFRNSYTSGPGVNPQGYSAHDSADGHRRAGIITGPDAPPPAQQQAEPNFDSDDMRGTFIVPTRKDQR